MKWVWIVDECRVRGCGWGGNAGRSYGSERAAKIAEAVHQSWHRRRGDRPQRSIDPVDQVIAIMKKRGWKLDYWQHVRPAMPTVGIYPRPECGAGALEFRFIPKDPE